MGWMSSSVSGDIILVRMTKKLVFEGSDIHYEEGNKTNISDPLTVSQRLSGHFCCSL